MASEAVSAIAVKKNRPTIAIRTLTSRTTPARVANSRDSSAGRPYSFTSSAPATLNRSVIVEPSSALPCICSRTRPCMRRPTYLAGTRNSGTSTSAVSVSCHDSSAIAPTTMIRLKTFETEPDSVDVNACWAPITSLFRRDTSDPVSVRVKNAIGWRCTWS